MRVYAAVSESPAAVFAGHAARGELAYQVAPDGSAVFPPRVGLPWRVSAGTGTVHATTVIRARDAAPRSVVLVDLDEGFRMMSSVVGIAPEDVAIGLRVAVRFEDDVPVFAPC